MIVILSATTPAMATTEDVIDVQVIDIVAVEESDFQSFKDIDLNQDFTALMTKALDEGDLEKGSYWEKCRNYKIDFLNLGDKYCKTYFFEGKTTVEDVREAWRAKREENEWKEMTSENNNSFNLLLSLEKLAKDGSDDAWEKGKELNKIYNERLKDEGGYAVDWWFFSRTMTKEEVVQDIQDTIKDIKEKAELDLLASSRDLSVDDDYSEYGQTGFRPRNSNEDDNDYYEVNTEYEVYGEYAVAKEVLDELRLWGLSDIVISGILGNMMTECGGQTLNLDWDIIGYEGNDEYWGLCQWSKYYNPMVFGADIKGQLAYLKSTIKHNIEMFGGNWEYFCSIENPREAALYFQNYYERGLHGDRRANNAEKAYSWILSL